MANTPSLNASMNPVRYAAHRARAASSERKGSRRVVSGPVGGIAYPRRLGRNDVATSVALDVREMSRWFEIDVMALHPAKPTNVLGRVCAKDRPLDPPTVS